LHSASSENERERESKSREISSVIELKLFV
jgi:hypothetical protein